MLTTTVPAALARTGSRIFANGQNPEALFRDLNTAVTAHITRTASRWKTSKLP